MRCRAVCSFTDSPSHRSTTSRNRTAATPPHTDGGTLDGDTEWDRAVGPMQFIPATWALYAQDGSRSGSSDPHQYDDAALTAAVYLCESGGDLTSDEGWVDAVVAYNQSVEYVNDVAAHAQDYVSPEES